MHSLPRAILSGCLILLPGVLLADTVMLHGGEALEGQVTGQSLTTITFRTQRGVQTIEKKRIARIQYGETSEEIRLRQERERQAKELAKSRTDQEARRLAEKIRAEDQAASAALQQRRQLVSSVASELARIEEKEKELERQQKLLEEEKVRVENQKQAALLRQKVESGDLHKDVLFRSLILPGYGQIYADRPLRGGILGGSFFLAAAGALSYNRSLADVRSEYRGGSLNRFFLPAFLPADLRSAGVLYTLNQNRNLYNRLSSIKAKADITLALALALYAFQAWDAWTRGLEWETDLRSALSPSKSQTNIFETPERAYSLSWSFAL